MTYAVVDAPGFHGDHVRIISVHRSKDIAMRRATEHQDRVITGCDIKAGRRIPYRSLLRHLCRGDWRIVKV